MKKLLMFTPQKGTPPLTAFLNIQDPKLRAKLESLFVMLAVTPIGLLHEPHVKHFTIEKYSALYELRAKSKLLARIIFTVRPSGDILFLAPFIKTHKRNTIPHLQLGAYSGQAAWDHGFAGGAPGSQTGAGIEFERKWSSRKSDGSPTRYTISISRGP